MTPMRHVAACLLLLAAAGGVGAQAAPAERPDPRTELRQLLRDYSRALRQLAKEAPELDQLGRVDRAARELAPRFLALGERSDDAVSAREALLWAAQYAPDADASGARAVALLVERFAADPAVLRILPSVERFAPPLAEAEAVALLDRIGAGQTEDDARSRCHFYAARLLLHRRPGEPAPPAARQHLERSLALTRSARRRDAAGRALHAATVLDVGARAPAIRGERFDGAPFDLADRRGKVVLLAFWADW